MGLMVKESTYATAFHIYSNMIGSLIELGSDKPMFYAYVFFSKGPKRIRFPYSF